MYALTFKFILLIFCAILGSHIPVLLLLWWLQWSSVPSMALVYDGHIEHDVHIEHDTRHKVLYIYIYIYIYIYTRMIKNLRIEGIHYTATKSKEARNKILALASTKDSQEIAN